MFWAGKTRRWRPGAVPSRKEGYQSTGFDNILFGATSWSTALMLKLALMQGALPVHMCWVPAHR